MKKINQDNWKPSYFYIKYVTVGQFLPLIKEAVIGFFSFAFLFGIIGYFSVDDWNASGYEQGKINSLKPFLGISHFIWFLIIFAVISWFIRTKERTFTIPRFDKVEWAMANFTVITFVLLFNYASWWICVLAYIAAMVIGKTYDDMRYIGKENYENKNYDN